MNDRQRKFCELYAASGNATAAAKAAGYSERTAYSQGARLLRNDEIIDFLNKEYLNSAASDRIATVEDVKMFWSTIMNNPACRVADRLTASSLLAKAAGILTPRTRPDDGGVGYAAGEDWDDDVIIMLPDNGRDSDLPKKYVDSATVRQWESDAG